MNTPDSQHSKPAAIEFLSAAKTFNVGKAGEFVALKGLNLRIEQGEFFGLLGHNGAGKTTAINLLCGVAKPTSGRIEVLGMDTAIHETECKRALGVVAQELIADSYFPLPLMLKIQSRLSGVKPDPEWIDFLLQQLALKNHVKKTTRELSGGMKRRMMIARALVHRPKVIILDEPTAGVDVELRHSMWAFISELHKMGLTIVLTTHYLEEAEQFCNRLAILKSGEIVTVKTNHELLQLGNKPRIVFTVRPDEGAENIDAWIRTHKSALDPELAKYQINLEKNSGPQVSNDLGGFLLSTNFDENSSASFLEASARLNSFALQNKLRPLKVTTAHSSLEEVFLKLSH